MKIIWKNYFFLLCSFALTIVFKNNFAIGSTIETSAEVFPFHAVIDSVYICSGILISDDFLLCPATCVNGTTWEAKIHLGFNADAFYQPRFWENNTEVLHSYNIIVHEKFTKISSQIYLNNIALIQLSNKVIFRENIQPGQLMSIEQFQLIGETSVNVTGWHTTIVSNISLAQARLVNPDSCNYVYKDGFFKNQETCIEWERDSRLNLSGNIVSLNGNILGYVVRGHCANLTQLGTCNDYDKVLTIPSYLDWIAEKTNISVKALTNQVPGDKIILEKLNDISKAIQELSEQNLKNGKRLIRLETSLKRAFELMLEIKEGVEDSCITWNEP